MKQREHEYNSQGNEWKEMEFKKAVKAFSLSNKLYYIKLYTRWLFLLNYYLKKNLAGSQSSR
jgi:hypothetical protein